MMPRQIRQALVAGSVFVFLVVTIALGVTIGLNLQYLGWQYLTRETTTVEVQEVPVEETVVRRIEARPITDLERRVAELDDRQSVLYSQLLLIIGDLEDRIEDLEQK